jgi:hypothetical protein
MQRKLIGLVAASLLYLLAEQAFAQISFGQDHNFGPRLGLHTSDVVSLPLEHHQVIPAVPWAGWAGYKFTVHVLDNTEVDVDAVRTYPFDSFSHQQVPGPIYHDPFGPRSHNVESQPREWMLLHPLHQQSGVTLNSSAVYPVADIEMHLKGTDNPAQNSDTDVVVQLWNIWHYRHGYTSQIVPLAPSDRIWVGSSINDIEQLHVINSQYGFIGTPVIPPISSTDPTGHWLHVNHPLEFHFYGSQFYATLADTITIGIEHIPEPASIALAGFGGICALMAARAHHQRRSK